MKKLVYIVLICAIGILAYYGMQNPVGRLEKNDEEQHAAQVLSGKLAENYNLEGLKLKINGSDVPDEQYLPYIGSDLHVMLPIDAVKDKLGCTVDEYANGGIIIKRNDHTVRIVAGSADASFDEEKVTLQTQPVKNNDKLYVPIEYISDAIDYTCEYNYSTGQISLQKKGEDTTLPAVYDMRKEGRVTEVRDQGDSGTCWAFASLAALETTLMPDENLQFSVDNMTKNNGFGIEQFEGGQYRMSIAYLASWKGPVLEKDDPYGDDETNSKLKAVKHLQEAEIIEDKDLEAVKEAVYKKGGVETAIYSDMVDADSDSEYYNRDHSSYYYDGTEGINHDVVIVGWDDNYSRNNFNKTPKKDGAFICKNSWGTDFGDEGYFYISYYDAHICETSVVYTKLEPAYNYDKIYQADKLGWVGVLGFDNEEAYFANVYKAGKNEELAAVAFYATGAKTTYEVYVVTDFQDEDSLADRKLVASGEVEYAGYYTVDLEQAEKLADGKKFAVVVHITTPDTKYPIAIEYDADSLTDSFDIKDGEGYLSLYGKQWYSAEKDRKCNVCLKAFTRTVE